MKFARAGAPGLERPVVSVERDVWLDLSGLVDDIDGSIFERVHEIRLAIQRGELPPTKFSRFGAAIASPGKILCIGLNYASHARETGQEAPAEPVVFMKAPDTMVGCDDDVLIPRGSTKTDYEVELAVVIGRTSRYLDSPSEAANHIGGFAISNDVSEREFQLERGGTWDKGKNCETFNPFGPWISTADEVGDYRDLQLRTSVNGIERQKCAARDMIFDVPHIIWYLSQFMVLHPGDIVNTGTPSGVAMGLSDAGYLRHGDVVEIAIDGLGVQRQTFRDAIV